MLKYIIKRIILVPVMVIATTFVIFLLTSLTPDDPAVQMLPANYTQEQLDEMHEELGLDKPLLIQYVNWLFNAVRGDFGISYSQKIPVTDAIKDRIPLSLALALLATLLIVVLGVPIGVMCAVKQYHAFDAIMNVLAKFLSAFPNFWLAMMMVLLFSLKLGWLPSFGFGTPAHWIMPVVALALPDLGGYVRQARSSMLDCIRQDYVRTARSKGAKESQVMLRSAALSVGSMEYVESAKALGAGTGHILLRHYVHNITSVLIIQFTQNISINITVGATLSFIGLGVKSPTPEWGMLLSDGIPLQK